eukprot:EG_transcript_15799
MLRGPLAASASPLQLPSPPRPSQVPLTRGVPKYPNGGRDAHRRTPPARAVRRAVPPRVHTGAAGDSRRCVSNWNRTCGNIDTADPWEHLLWCWCCQGSSVSFRAVAQDWLPSRHPAAEPTPSRQCSDNMDGHHALERGTPTFPQCTRIPVCVCSWQT